MQHATILQQENAESDNTEDSEDGDKKKSNLAPAQDEPVRRKSKSHFAS